jgi:predicted PurR-regulated permease PerM
MRQGLGWFAIVAGVLGALVCLLLVPVVWVAHGAAQTEARTLIDTVDGALEEATAQLANGEAAVGTVNSRLGSLRTRAEAIAANPTAGEQERAELRALLGGVIAIDYQTVRAAYIGARAQAAASLALLKQFTWIPGIRAPSDEVIQQAVQIDAQLQTIDAQLTALGTALEGSELSISEAAARLAERVGALEQQVATLDETIGTYATTVDTVRARLPEIAVTTARVITTLAVVLTLVALYGVLLHAALFVLGRSWTRPRARVAAR